MGLWTRFGGRHGPPMRALFGENVCENERIGSRGGGGVRRKILYVDPPMLVEEKRIYFKILAYEKTRAENPTKFCA